MRRSLRHPTGSSSRRRSQDATLAAFAPTHVLVAPTTADLAFPEVAGDADKLLTAEEARWTGLWRRLRTGSARVVQHAFVVPDETVLGHLSARVREQALLVRELNGRLGAAAGSSVLLVDCERLAARVGKKQWSDPRLWYAARQPYGYTALPLVARDTAAVIAADVGVAARCLVVDLDNTLWGGVVGDEGPNGIVLGEGPEGEAYAAFQSYLRALKERGVLLAVASKNDVEAAREPFERNPKMECGSPTSRRSWRTGGASRSRSQRSPIPSGSASIRSSSSTTTRPRSPR
jgi:predicted enzyme involved in methoxymalonyl-ACP biosynthesis